MTPSTISTTTAAPTIFDRIGLQLSYTIPDPADIRDPAPILAPLMLVAAMNAAATLSLRGLMSTALAANPGAATAIDAWLLILVAAAPLVEFLKAVVLATVTWAILVLLSQDVRYRVLLSIQIYGGIILALPALVTVMVVRLRGVDRITGPQDLLVPMGPGAFFDPGTDATMLTLAQQLSIFHLLWVAFIAWLLVRSADVRRGMAIAISVTLWAAGAAYALLGTVVAR